MGKRLIAIAARASSMLAVFIFGLVYTATTSFEQASTFFIAYAAVTLAIVIMGLELHTYSDREITRGMPPRVAMMGLLRIQLPWMLVVTACLVLCGGWLGWSISTVLLVAGNAAVGLAVQECFRMFVALGRNDSANLSMIIRTTLPFGTLTILLILGVPVGLDLVFATWLIGGVLGAAFSVYVLWRKRTDAEQHEEYSVRKAFRAGSRFFPSVLVARGMLTLDIIIIGAVGTAALTAAYGNVANITTAFITFADLAVLQWRFRSLVGSAGGKIQTRKVLRDALGVAVIGAATLTGIALLAGTGVLGDPFASAPVVLSFIILAFALSGTIVAQALQITLYSRNDDSTIFRGYLFVAGPIFATLAAAAIVLHLPLLVVLARALGFAALVGYFLFSLRKGTAS